MDKTAQEILTSELLEDDEQGSNETLELFKFMRDNSTKLSDSQVQAMLLLNENGLSDISSYMMESKRTVTPVTIYYKILDKLTMADRIKGNAKLSHLMKASANPAEGIKSQDLQAQGMSRREIDK